MYCLKYWARYVRKGEMKSGGIHNTHKEKIKRFLASKGVLSGGALGLNTLCRDCSSHTTLVGLLYLGGDKSEKICTDYKV